MATWIIGGIVAAAMVLALRYIRRKHQKGECPGCAGCGCGRACPGHEPKN